MTFSPRGLSRRWTTDFSLFVQEVVSVKSSSFGNIEDSVLAHSMLSVVIPRAQTARACEAGCLQLRIQDLEVDNLSFDGVVILIGDLSNTRSEEHTSELQSTYDLVCRLL